MKYECCLKDGRFSCAKPAGWPWSADDRREFSIVAVDIEPMPEDYVVEIDGVEVMASQIDAGLVETTYGL